MARTRTLIQGMPQARGNRVKNFPPPPPFLPPCHCMFCLGNACAAPPRSLRKKPRQGSQATGKGQGTHPTQTKGGKTKPHSLHDRHGPHQDSFSQSKWRQVDHLNLEHRGKLPLRLPISSRSVAISARPAHHPGGAAGNQTYHDKPQECSDVFVAVTGATKVHKRKKGKYRTCPPPPPPSGAHPQSPSSFILVSIQKSGGGGREEQDANASFFRRRPTERQGHGVPGAVACPFFARRLPVHGSTHPRAATCARIDLMIPISRSVTYYRSTANA